MKSILLEQTRRRGASNVGWLFILYFACSPLYAQETSRVSPVVVNDPVLGRIAEKDRKFPEQFTAVFEMRRAACQDPKQGTQINLCELTVGDGTTILIIHSKFETDPVFRSLSTPGYQEFDFDASGNLVVWRSLEKKSISTTRMNRVFDLQERNLVAPSGQLVDRSVHRQVYEYPIGSPDSVYEARQFQMAMGRAYSRQLSSLKSQRIDERGLWEVVAAGTFGPALTGEWTLQMESQSEPLVRMAIFRPRGQDDPAIKVVTEGWSDGDTGLRVASRGTLYLGRISDDSRVDVKLLDYQPAPPDSDFLTRLREQLEGPIPVGTEVIDYSGYEPRRHIVGDGNGQ